MRIRHIRSFENFTHMVAEMAPNESVIFVGTGGSIFIKLLSRHQLHEWNKTEPQITDTIFENFKMADQRLIFVADDAFDTESDWVRSDLQ
jgi:hypothetical protein